MRFRGLEREKRETKKMGEAFAYKEYLAGLLAGVATVITGRPFDTVKVSALQVPVSHFSDF